MVIMGMGNKEIVQWPAFQGVFNILYGAIRAKSHTAVKQRGIIFPDKKIAFACFVRDAVNILFHIFNNT